MTKTYFEIVSAQFNVKRPNLKDYKIEWKSLKTSISFNEYLGLTQSQYALLQSSEDNFFKLMVHYHRLVVAPGVKMIDGIPYRMRRGNWVPINLNWLGQITTRLTKARRKSRRTY